MFHFFLPAITLFLPLISRPAICSVYTHVLPGHEAVLSGQLRQKGFTVCSYRMTSLDFYDMLRYWKFLGMILG